MRSNDSYTAARALTLFLAAVMLLVLAGCSSLKVVETWRKPALAEHRYQKLMILGLSKDQNLRMMFENIVAEELRSNHIKALPSHTIIPDLDKSTREDIIAAVRAAGIDAVLTTRASSVGNSKVDQGREVGYVYGAGPKAADGFLRATLQAALYDVGTAELVWFSTINTFDAKMKARVSRELGSYFVEVLRREGLM